jgi:hypothetical protein
MNLQQPADMQGANADSDRGCGIDLYLLVAHKKVFYFRGKGTVINN